jgi:hypothetical protein
MTMALKRHLFDVYMAPLDDDGKPDFDADPLEFLSVRVVQGDMIRAELEANKQAIPDGTKAAMTSTTLWAWAAMSRTGQTSARWTAFKDSCVAVQPVKTPEGKAATEDVDPTQPAPSGTPSSSPPTSAEGRPTGSTPTSTTD